MKSLRAFYHALTDKERQEFADSIGVCDKYVRHHLITQKRTPSPKLIRKMVQEADGMLSFVDVLGDVYPELLSEIGEDGSKTSERPRPIEPTPATCAADQSDTTGVSTENGRDHVAPTKVPRG